MKLLLCADVRLGAVCAENLGASLSHKWQAVRTKKLTNLIDKAAQNNARYIALFGQMFGQKRVPESVIDSLFQAVKQDAHIQVLTFLSADEYERITYRNDIPENLHLICTQMADSFCDEQIALRMDSNSVELQLSDNTPVWIEKNVDGRFVLRGMGEKQVIPSFEPIGFEDAAGAVVGYSVLEWTENALIDIRLAEDQTYAFQSVELKILQEDDQKEIRRKIHTAVARIDTDTFLRITIIGRSAFGITLNGDALAAMLQDKIFFVEVYDNTSMAIEEEEFENDISLRSEFVRLALQEGSLSESERSRIISYGYNALSDKEVSAE